MIGDMYFHIVTIAIAAWCFCLQCQLQYLPYREIKLFCVATKVNKEGWALQQGLAQGEWVLSCLRTCCNWLQISKLSAFSWFLVEIWEIELNDGFLIVMICSFGGWAVYGRPLALRPPLAKSLPFREQVSSCVNWFGKMDSDLWFLHLSFFIWFLTFLFSFK